jgi:hypothetical protein
MNNFLLEEEPERTGKGTQRNTLADPELRKPKNLTFALKAISKILLSRDKDSFFFTFNFHTGIQSQDSPQSVLVGSLGMQPDGQAECLHLRQQKTRPTDKCWSCIHSFAPALCRDRLEQNSCQKNLAPKVRKKKKTPSFQKLKPFNNWKNTFAAYCGQTDHSI